MTRLHSVDLWSFFGWKTTRSPRRAESTKCGVHEVEIGGTRAASGVGVGGAAAGAARGAGLRRCAWRRPPHVTVVTGAVLRAVERLVAGVQNADRLLAADGDDPEADGVAG